MMFERRRFLGAAIGATFFPRAALAREPASAFARMHDPGPENRAMAKRAGVWDVTETVWASPGAPPVTTTGLVAERRAIGSMLQEIMRPVGDPSDAAIARIDYLSFNRVEARWEYVSMDMRAPVGIMTAQSFGAGDGRTLDLEFQPFAFVGASKKVAGQMLRMNEVIAGDGPDRDEKLQHFIMADGVGTMWLAHRYAYTRRRK